MKLVLVSATMRTFVNTTSRIRQSLVASFAHDMWIHLAAEFINFVKIFCSVWDVSSIPQK